MLYFNDYFKKTNIKFNEKKVKLLFKIKLNIVF